MGPFPRELQSKDIFLYESLGIEFYEALFNHQILNLNFNILVSNCKRLDKISDESKNNELAKNLWDRTCDWVKLDNQYRI